MYLYNCFVEFVFISCFYFVLFLSNFCLCFCFCVCYIMHIQIQIDQHKLKLNIEFQFEDNPRYVYSLDVFEIYLYIYEMYWFQQWKVSNQQLINSSTKSISLFQIQIELKIVFKTFSNCESKNEKKWKKLSFLRKMCSTWLKHPVWWYSSLQTML
jgi:hypothetical protein